jgi:hypothetical protein
MSHLLTAVIRRSAALAATVLLVAGCGGGGSSGAAAARPTPAPAPAPAPPPAPLGFASGTFADSSRFENLCAAPRTSLDPNGRPWPDVPGTTVDENDFLRSWSHELYLWFDEIEDVDPASLATPEYFDLMRTFETTPSGAPKDRFHFTQPTDEFLAFTQSGETAGYGAELAVLASSPPREVRVAFSEPGSPASAAGVVRGAEIRTVDGVDVRLATSQADIDVLNAALFRAEPGDTHVFGVLDRGAMTVREVTLTAQQLTTTPVRDIRVHDTPSGPVGYFLFNDHIATAEAGLIDAVEVLIGAGVTDLVLDMRYNGGGRLAIAAELAYMIAGPAAAAGEVFDELQFNSKHQVFNPVTGQVLAPDLFPTQTLGLSRPAGQPLPSLDLERVYVLTGPGTCSASETVMNGLRGIGVEVVQIGERTCGKPYGFYPRDNCGTTYFSIQFRGINAQGWGDYADGFAPGMEAGPAGVVPGCTVEDDFDRDLGDPAEGRLAAALTYRATGACPVAASSVPTAPTGFFRGEPGPAIGPPPWRQGAWRMP